MRLLLKAPFLNNWRLNITALVNRRLVTPDNGLYQKLILDLRTPFCPLTITVTLPSIDIVFRK